MTPAILIIEDEYALAAALSTVVRRMEATPVVAASGQGGIEKLSTQPFALVILDVGLPDISGIKVLEKVQAMPQPPPVVIITAHGTLETALQARRLGAREYFLKPLDLPGIQRTIREIMGGTAQERVEARLDTTMIGTSELMQRAFAVIAQASGCETPVLFQGPPGSGKSLAAQVVHRHSSRGEKPFVVFRADEWPGDRVEAAFNEAVVRAADGVLCLDEIATWPKPLQAVLMNQINAGTLKVRLFSASSHDLAAKVAEGEFREDLFYSLAVLKVTMPALKDRTADIPALAASLTGELALSAETLAVLKGYAWPGNVRELQTALTHAAAVCGSSTILPHHLPAGLVVQDRSNHLEDAMRRGLEAWLDQKTTTTEELMPAYDDLLETVETAMLDVLLKRFEGKPTRLAAAMKMNRATLRRKLREV